MSLPRPGIRSAATGFTLIELMVTCAIVAILAAIAYPNYTSFIQRGKIIDATTKLSDFRVKMEQYFQDNRSYANGKACGVADPASGPNDAFSVACTTPDGASYTVKATGLATRGMDKFVYTLTVDGTGLTKKTTGVPTGWKGADNCWTTRKDGSCG
jgi:type IV pilus assembly protein PilE